MKTYFENGRAKAQSEIMSKYKVINAVLSHYEKMREKLGSLINQTIEEFVRIESKNIKTKKRF